MENPMSFETAEAAWFWAAAALRARREGARPVSGGPLRPCTPDDIVLCLERLYRAREIGPMHARVLRRWGDAGFAPDPKRWGDRGDVRLWREAMARLQPMLVRRGIVSEIFP
jgi:hypothetical protein